MKKYYGVNHAYFNCTDCDKEFANYKNAQALAAQHAKKYGHTVVGDVCIGFKYDGSKQPTEEL